MLRQLDTRREQRTVPVWAWPIVAVLIFFAGVIGARLVPQGGSVAVWWPAAGISVLFLLLTKSGRSHWWAAALVVAATMTANLVGGRPLIVAFAFGLANAAEAIVVVRLVHRPRSPRLQLDSLAAAFRFAGAVLAGALLVGILAGVIVVWLNNGTFFPAAGFVAASHAAAVLMIAPLGLLPRHFRTHASLAEVAAQFTVLMVVIALVFSTLNDYPLAFLPYPLLAWAAFRFPLRVAITETLLTSLAILIFTMVGGGPFNRDELDLSTRAALVEIFLFTFAGFAVVLSAAQYELRNTSRRLVTTSRLLSGSLLEASIGLAIAEHNRGGEIRIGWANPAAVALIRADTSARWEGPLADAAVEALASSGPITVYLPDARTITVAANRIPDETDRFAIQLINVTDALHMQAATFAAEREHEAARSAREDLERQRDDFVATTSHELRTPITSIVGYGELLTDSDTLAPQERTWVDIITRNAERLSALVEDLLTIGKINDGRSAVQPRAANLPDLFTEILGNIRILADQRSITLNSTPRTETVYVDPDDLHQILTNLVANAVKFTPAHGAVNISAIAIGQTVAIIVADTGPGMSAEALEHAFDRFYRAPDAERDSVPGTGLGLAIVADLVARNNGQIALTTPSSGGLTATVTLPRMAP